MYTKKPVSTSFGTTSHPSELFAQARAHNRNSQGWRQQLDALDDNLARAKQAIALWCVASEPVVTELWLSLESEFSRPPAPRRGTVLGAAEQFAGYDRLS